MGPDYWKNQTESTLIRPLANGLVIPGGTYVAQPWADVSLMIAEFPIGNESPFSLLKPLLFDLSIRSQFILCVRWLIDDEGTVARYKIWDNSDGVLFFPVYAGQKIGVNAVMEMWSVEGTEEVVIEDIALRTSVFSLPQLCNCPINPVAQSVTLVAREPVTIDPESACNPFCVCFLT